MSTEVVIDVRNLEKVYDGTVAVDGLDIQVAAGKILGLVGPNGSGKTTSMKCMSGIIPATRGSIKIDGHDLKEDPRRAKAHLAFIPDTPHLFDYLTVEEHFQFIGRIYHVNDPIPKIDSLLEEFELVEKRGVLPDTLSRGMKQKLAICLGFLHDPNAILLDEPIIGLDPVGIRRMKESIVRRARESGAAVLISSHQLGLVEEICDEVLIIKEGRRVIGGTLQEIRTQLDGLPENATLEDIFFRATLKSEKTAPETHEPELK